MPVNLGAIALAKTKQLEKRIKVLEDKLNEQDKDNTSNDNRT
jgi:hypothetical protein